MVNLGRYPHRFDGHAMNEYVPGLEGVPATRSNISFIDGEKGILAYRGYAIEQLAEQSSFEETALVLLDGQLPTVESLSDLDNQLRHNRRVKYNIATIMKRLPTTGHPMEMLQTAVASLGMFYPGSEKLTRPNAWQDVEYVHRMSVKIIARMATLVAMWERIRSGYDPVAPRLDLTYAQNFLYMMTGREPDPVIAKMLDTCLILHAEHTIKASTFAALVAGSTLATPRAVVAAASGSLFGPLHVGVIVRVVEMLEEFGSAEKVRPWLDANLI